LNFDAHPRSSLIVALDFDSLNTALKFAKQVADLVGMFKIGSQLFTAAGPAAVKEISALGPGIFLDLKFHDIPNTVAGAVLSSAAMTGVQLVNVHALGGTAMLHAAAQAISAGVPMGADRPRLIAVTVLTSMDAKAIREVGIGGPPKTRVVKLAKLAKSAGVDGVVASVQEARAIRKACGRDFLIVTPGVRPATKSESASADGSSKSDHAAKLKTPAPKSDDQARTATPTEAIKAGADFLVVGRPITAAPDPRAAAQSIVDEIASAK
jgi:orotidine-5'-phosphate decarboxylase